MTRRRILLHIGSPKCGSTYLQEVMLQNRARLLRAAIRYPHDGGEHPGNAADLADLTRDRLDSWFSDAVHTVILSHENLYSHLAKPTDLVALAPAAGITVQLLVFLRPCSEIIYGDYSQYMKQFFEPWLASRTPYDGQDLHAFTYHRRRVIKPAAIVDLWTDRFSARPPILAGYRDIRATFDHLLGPVSGALDWNVPREKTNPSLRVEDCERVARAMRDPTMSDETIRDMMRQAHHCIGQPDAGRSPERSAWIESLFETENDRLLRQYGYDNRLRPGTG